MSTNPAAIKLVEVTKTYHLYHEKPTFVEKIFNRNAVENFIALNNINLEIKIGERVGIIGSNGSGKTTLLKVISGITTPNKGLVKISGKLVSLIDLSAGFHPELTGIENVFQNAMLLGMSRQETKKKMDQIIDLAGIDGFIDSPLYTYSEGMKLRLGFSVAVFTNPDILILDECVAAGDKDFNVKIWKKLDDMFYEGRTVILVAHWLEYLRKHCNRILWMEAANIKMDGGLEVVSKYEKYHY
jgi:ABC-type polysaccharide/polyol phosphate transport system ATPase subunit